MKELSPTNPYWLPKYRYLEIKNFALQYPSWCESVKSIDILGSGYREHIDSSPSDPVWAAYQRRELYLRNMKMVEDAARNTDEVLGPYVLLAATKGGSYENLRLMHNIPCCRDVYYDKLRKFYYILSQLRR